MILYAAVSPSMVKVWGISNIISRQEYPNARYYNLYFQDA